MANRLENDQIIGGFKVGDWLAEPMRNRLSLDGEGVQVEPKVMGVLMCLARHGGRTVTKDTFFEEVWEGTIVSEDVLSRCVSELRRVLQDDARQPRFIETIRKTGYRLIAQAVPYSVYDGPEAQLQPGFTGNGAPEAVTGSAQAAASQGSGRVLTWIAVAMVVVGSISLAAVVIYRSISDNAPMQRFVGPLQTVPYTSYRGLELDPILSPSGDQVAFAWDDDFTSDFDLYLKQTGAESPLRLTVSTASERFPSWSPDGLHLAFVRSTDSSNSVFTIPSIGGKERKVVGFGARQIRGLSWSPEGDYMAVSAQVSVGTAAALFLVPVDSTGFTQLTFPPPTHLGDINPSFSPDGNRLAFIRSLSPDVQDIYAISMDTRGVLPVTADSFAVTGVDWTHDGRSLVFASSRGYMSSLWRTKLRGGNPEWIVTASLGNVFEHPSVAPQGSRLTYVRRSSSTNLWRLTGLSTSRPDAHPVIFSTGFDSHPALAPDGQRLAFVSDQTGRPEIWVSDVDGRSPVQLTTDVGRPLTPRWSPDGSTLAFALRTSGQADIYLVDGEGGNPRQITQSGYEDVYPSWSRDGNWVIFASNRTYRWELWRARRDGSELEQITHSGAIAGMPSWDGSSIYFVRPEEGMIYKQHWSDPADEPEPVVEGIAEGDYANWFVVKDGIYHVRRSNAGATLSFFDFGSQRVRDVYPLPQVPRHPAVAVSADGTEIIYTRLDEDAADIQMVDSFD